MSEQSEEIAGSFERPAWWHRQFGVTATEVRQPSTVAWDDPTRFGTLKPMEGLAGRTLRERFPAARALSSSRVVASPVRVHDSVPRPRKWSTKSGQAHTYLVKADGSHLVKIGIALDPMQRLKTLQTGQPMDLYLMWSVPGDYEYDLHLRFAAHRYRGEWFDLRSLGDPVAVVTEAVNELQAARARA
jgi:hypothetical protein